MQKIDKIILKNYKNNSYINKYNTIVIKSIMPKFNQEKFFEQESELILTKKEEADAFVEEYLCALSKQDSKRARYETKCKHENDCQLLEYLCINCDIDTIKCYMSVTNMTTLCFKNFLFVCNYIDTNNIEILSDLHKFIDMNELNDAYFDADRYIIKFDKANKIKNKFISAKLHSDTADQILFKIILANASYESRLDIVNWAIKEHLYTKKYICELLFDVCEEGLLKVFELLCSVYNIDQAMTFKEYDNETNGFNIGDAHKENDFQYFRAALSSENIDIVEYIYNGIQERNKPEPDFYMLFSQLVYYSDKKMHINCLDWLLRKMTENHTFDLDKLSKCASHADTDTLKYMYSKNLIDIKKTFINCCIMRDFDCDNKMQNIEWIYSLNIIDIHENDDYVFHEACKKGKMDVCEWLLGKGNVKIKWDNGLFFKKVCSKLYNADIAKLLYESADDIHKDEFKKHHKENFNVACENRDTKMAKFLYSINNDIDIKIAFRQYFVRGGLMFIRLDDNDDMTHINFPESCNDLNLDFDLDFIKWCHSICPDFDIHTIDNIVLLSLCKHYSTTVDIFKYVCSMDANNINTYIHYANDSFFYLACVCGNLDLAQYIYSFGSINIRYNDDRLFKDCCYEQRHNVAEWLMTLCEDYFIETDDKYHQIIKKFNIKHWYDLGYVFDDVKKHLGIVKSDNKIDKECLICKDEANILTKCNHGYCIDCIIEWYFRRNNGHICTYCQTNINFNECVFDESIDNKTNSL